MERKFPVIIDDCMSGICPSLKPDDNIRLLGQHVRDLSFSFISPVSAYYRFYHYPFLLCE